MKGVILAAGYGTRFLPGSKTVPKEMFPLIDRPAVDFIVEEFILSGIEEILIITSRRKKVLEDYFDRETELETVLASKPEYLDRIRPPRARFTCIRQQEMRGTGDALLLCENFSGGQPLVIAYPDDLVFSDVPLSRQLIEARKSPDDSVLAVMRVPPAETHRYGIVETGKDGAVTGITEKPVPGTAKSDLALIGRYIITPEIFPLLRLEKEKNPTGEYYQIEPVNSLAAMGKVRACAFAGSRLDIGQPDGYLKAIMEYALLREDLKEVLKETAKGILDRD